LLEHVHDGGSGAATISFLASEMGFGPSCSEVLPSASTALAIVFAVYMPAQDPPGMRKPQSPEFLIVIYDLHGPYRFKDRNESSFCCPPMMHPAKWAARKRRPPDDSNRAIAFIAPAYFIATTDRDESIHAHTSDDCLDRVSNHLARHERNISCLSVPSRCHRK